MRIGYEQCKQWHLVIERSSMAESDSENVEVTSDSEWEYLVPRFTIDS